jgi:ankyrin repeat protein
MAGHARLVKLLIDYGADVNSLCHSGHTPLFHAIASGHHEVMQLLLETGASPATRAQTYGTIAELRLELVISGECYICGQRRTSFIVGF